MAGFIEGVDRGQSVLFPDRLDDWIGEDSLVRVVDLFVDELDLPRLGFARSAPARTGRPGYHPSVLLKLFIYGYLNRIPSSRRLEREAGRNVEVMWLTGRLVPDHKTIADFRRDNGTGIRKVCAQFVELCRRIGTLKGGCVAVDGSKFKAVNNRDRNFTKGKIASRIAHLEADVERYITEMVRIDRQEEGEARTEKVDHLSRRYGRIRQEIDRLKAMDQALADAPDGQISLTDPDARSMATSARHSGMVGYNVQSAVDTETHLIVAHEVTNQGFDREQLSPMATAAKEALGRDDLHAIADKGYFSSPEILACHEAGITTTVPRPATSGNAVKGMYVKADFVYDAGRDVYVCPAGEDLTYRYTTEERSIQIRRYWINGCKTCPLQTNCTTGNERRISRWEREDLVDEMDTRLGRDPDYMTLRRCTVEHPFGTIKAWMGSTHFLTRRLMNVRSEMALNVLAYNIKRMVALLGVGGLMQAMQG
jgi:transposase